MIDTRRIVVKSEPRYAPRREAHQGARLAPWLGPGDATWNKRSLGEKGTRPEKGEEGACLLQFQSQPLGSVIGSALGWTSLGDRSSLISFDDQQTNKTSSTVASTSVNHLSSLSLFALSWSALNSRSPHLFRVSMLVFCWFWSSSSSLCERKGRASCNFNHSCRISNRISPRLNLQSWAIIANLFRSPADKRN